ncbi:MAG: class I SAM-dependent methyltransferase, partial [Paracoccaceae bacterium]
HYYEPLFNDALLWVNPPAPRSLPGVDLNIDAQINFLKELNFSGEFKKYYEENSKAAANRFDIENGSFESGDAEFLYSFVRKVRPKKVIEIGCGSSTKLISSAISHNKIMDSVIGRHICIEPYEQKWLDDYPSIEIKREKVEECKIDWVNELEAGDLLFIDSSHMIRPQGDVLYEYLELIPRLRSGVYVHVHDIFTPRDYSKKWISEDVRFWNEQYLLEALISNGGRYEVIAALNYLKHERYDDLKAVCPYLTESREPGSFYFRIK